MRICIVNEFFYPDNTGGTGTVLSNLARQLVDGYPGVELSVITSRNQYRAGGATLPAYENWHGIHIHRLATPRPSSTSASARLAVNFIFSIYAFWKLLFLPRHDILLVGTAPPPTPMAALWYSRLRGVPYVYVTYDLEPDRAVALKLVHESSLSARILRRIQHGWLNGAARVVVLGRCMQEHILSSYNLPDEKVTPIPIGFDSEQVFPMEKSTRFRAEHLLTGFVVLYAGNFGRYHNFDAILNAAGSLLQQKAEITFVLVGGGAQKAHIAERIEHEGLTNVKLMPFVPFEEFADLQASADVSMVTLEPGMEGLCVPSKFYSILSAGRPTIAMVGEKSEVARVIEEDYCGIRVDAGDSFALVQALQRLADDPELLAAMGHNARKTLLANYSNVEITRKYYQVFQESLGISATATQSGRHSADEVFPAESVSNRTEGAVKQ